MKRLPDLLRAALALTGGLLLAGTLAAPAAAEHPEPAPTPFEVKDIGDDLCTEFYAEGQAAWRAVHDPEVPSVEISGTGAIIPPPPDTICLSVENRPRQIEFTAYAGGEEVDFHSVPFAQDEVGPFPGSPFDFAFSLSSRDGTPIEEVAIAVCTSEDTWGDRCGEAVVVAPGGGGDPEPDPRDALCQYTFTVTEWSGGYFVEVSISAITTGWGIEDWRAVTTLPEGQSVNTAYNVIWVQNGRHVEFEPANWGAQLPTDFGFGVQGGDELPEDFKLWADGNRCARV